MTIAYNYNQAKTELASRPEYYTTVERLKELLGKVSSSVLDANEDSTYLLYTGEMLDGTKARDLSSVLVGQTANMFDIGDSEVGQFLDSSYFQNALRRVIRLEVVGDYSPATAAQDAEILKRIELLVNGRDELGNRVNTDSLWDFVSKEYTKAAEGNFKIIAPDEIDPKSVFATSEIDLLLENPNVTSIDGIPRAELKNILEMHGKETLLDVIHANSLAQIKISGLSLTDVDAYRALDLPSMQSLAESNPERVIEIFDEINQSSPEKLAKLSKAAKILNKLGPAGSLIGLLIAANQASAAEEAGRPEEAKEIMALWAADEVGSGIGFFAGATAGGILLGIGALVGVTVSAPVAGALVIGLGLVGAFVGADEARDWYESLQDRDGNDTADIFDRVMNLLGGVDYLPSKLPTDAHLGVVKRINANAAITAEEVMSNAKNSMAWRYALRELNTFVVLDIDYSKHNLDGSLDDGAMTAEYLEDRSKMLLWKITYDEQALSYNRDLETNSVLGNWDFIDKSMFHHGLQELHLAIDGAGLSKDDHQIVFGGKSDDVLTGSNTSDRLYGGAGNDTLKGGKGNDYLEGGTGFDTYEIDDGQHTIFDVDQSGRIVYRGEDINFGDQNLWEQRGPSGLLFTYGDFVVQVMPAGSNVNNLKFWHKDTPNDFVLIKSFQNGRMGIFIPALVEEPEKDPSNTIIGDLAPIDADLTEPGLQLSYDKNGNVVVDPNQLAVGREDILYDSAEDNRIYGLDGDDVITAGRGGNDYLDGGEGNDIIKAGSGNDILVGDEGLDILFGGAGDDLIYGGKKLEITEERTQGGTGSSKAKGDFLDGGEGNDVLVGSDQNDALFGGKGDDVIYAGDGDDNISGDGYTSSVKKDWQFVRNVYERNGVMIYEWEAKNYNYQVSSQGGNDVIYAGAGNDWVFAGVGNDFVDGGSGNDVIFGNEGNDDIWGGDGDDIIMGDNGAGSSVGAGNDTLHGGKGNDEMWGDAGNDTLYGDEGNDILIGDNSGIDKSLHGDDYLDGGTGDDILIGGGGNDTLFGGEGNDRLYGDGGDLGNDLIGNDYLHGGAGDDELIGGGNDVLFGGDGNDRLFGDGSDTDTHLTGDDYLDGGSGDDYLWGGAGNDHLFGGEGNDYLDGGEGDDYLNGGEGDDLLVSQAGNDILLGGAGDDQYLIFLKDGNTVTVNDTVGWDRIQLNGASFRDAVFTRTGSDLTITTSNGTLIVQNYREIDWITFDDQEVNLEIIDLILSGELAAEAGSGDVYLESFHKQITTLVGQEGNDYLVANFEGMTLKGGSGNDSYYLNHTDAVIEESADGGQDIVYLQGNINSYTLTDQIEDLTVMYGSEVGVINGNASNNRIEGNEGNQIINSGAGDDYLIGGGGNDTFNAGTGMDYIEGGAGQDTYIFNLGDSSGRDSGKNQSLFLETVVDVSTSNIISFGVGITPDDITFTQMGTKQLMQYSDQDSVIIPGGSDFAIFKFADGSEYTFDELKQIQLNNGTGISTGGTGEQPIRQDYSNYTLGTQRGDEYVYRPVFNIIARDKYDRPILGQTGWGVSGVIEYNIPPAVKNTTIDTQFVYAGDSWSLSFARDLFIDLDGDTLSYKFDQKYVFGNAYDNSWISFNSNAMTVSGAPHLLNNPQWNYGLHNLSLQAMDGKGGIAELDVDLIVGIRQEQQRSNVIDVILGSDDSDVITSGRGDITYGRDGNDHFRLSTEHNANIPSYVDTVFIGGKGADSYYVEKDQIISISDDDKSNILILGAGLRKEDMRITKYYGMGTQYTNQITFIGSDTVISFDHWHLFNQIHFANGDVLDGQNLGATTIRTETSYEPTIWTFDSGSVFETNPNEYNILDIEHAFSVNPDTGGSGFGLTGQSPSFNGFRFLGAYLQDGSELPSWLKFDKATGRLFGTALETDTDQSFIVTIKTIDKDGVAGYFDVSININLGVISDNSAPVVENIQSDLSVNEKDHFSIVLPENLFSDPDGDDLTFSLTLADGSALPNWLTYNSVTRTLSGTPQNDQVGDLSFKITATDPKGLSASQDFKLTVNNVNDAPIAHGSLVEQALKEGEAWQFALPSGSFIDIDKSDVLTYSLKMTDGSDIPSWLQIDAQTGLISGTPTGSGSLGILVIARDKAGANASHALNLNIHPLEGGNRAPIVTNALEDLSIDEKEGFRIALPNSLFNDPDGDPLIYKVTLANGSALPNWLFYDEITRTLIGAGQNNQVGEHNFKITATDPKGLSVSQNFKFTINNVNDAPIVQGYFAEKALREGDAWEFALPSGSFIDIDKGDVLTYSIRMADGSDVPDWLQIDTQTGFISGTPTVLGSLALLVVGTDKAGEEAFHQLNINVTPVQETVYGTDGDDDIYGSNGYDVIYGQAGNDQIYDMEGNNYLNGGDGDDTIIGVGTVVGGRGNDRVMSSNNEVGTTILFNLGDGQDTILGSASSYEYIDKNKIVFGAGITSDMIRFELDFSSLIIFVGDQGDQITLQSYIYSSSQLVNRIEFADGTIWTDIRDMIGPVIQNGTDEDDQLYGSALNDALYGGAGNDSLYGGERGSDYLDGGSGDDYLSANSGIFIGGTGNDVINIYGKDVQYNSYDGTMISTHDSTIMFNLGDGQDEVFINNNYRESQGLHTILFGDDVTLDMLTFIKEDQGLVIVVGNQGDKITLKQQGFSDEQDLLLNLKFADGSVWQTNAQTGSNFNPASANRSADVANQVNGLISAMAAFAPPSGGESSLISSQNQTPLLQLATSSMA